MPGDIPDHVIPDLEPDFVYLASVIAAQLRRGMPDPPSPYRAHVSVTHPTFREHLEGPVISSMQLTEGGILRVAARARVRGGATFAQRRRASVPPPQPTLLEEESDDTDLDLLESSQPGQPDSTAPQQVPPTSPAGQSLGSAGESASPSSESEDSQQRSTGAAATAAEQQQQLAPPPAATAPPTELTTPPPPPMTAAAAGGGRSDGEVSAQAATSTTTLTTSSACSTAGVRITASVRPTPRPQQQQQQQRPTSPPRQLQVYVPAGLETWDSDSDEDNYHVARPIQMWTGEPPLMDGPRGRGRGRGRTRGRPRAGRFRTAAARRRITQQLADANRRAEAAEAAAAAGQFDNAQESQTGWPALDDPAPPPPPPPATCADNHQATTQQSPSPTPPPTPPPDLLRSPCSADAETAQTGQPNALPPPPPPTPPPPPPDNDDKGSEAGVGNADGRSSTANGATRRRRLRLAIFPPIAVAILHLIERVSEQRLVVILAALFVFITVETGLILNGTFFRANGAIHQWSQSRRNSSQGHPEAEAEQRAGDDETGTRPDVDDDRK